DVSSTGVDSNSNGAAVDAEVRKGGKTAHGRDLSPILRSSVVGSSHPFASIHHTGSLSTYRLRPMPDAPEILRAISRKPQFEIMMRTPDQKIVIFDKVSQALFVYHGGSRPFQIVEGGTEKDRRSGASSLHIREASDV